MAAVVSLLLAFIPAFLARRSGMTLSSVAVVAGALGLLGSALALPFTGPLPLGLVATILVLVAALAASRVEAAAAATTDRSLSALFCGAGAGLAAAAATWMIRGELLHPWPFAFVLVSMILLGIAAGRAIGQRIARGAAIALASACIVALFLVGHGLLADVIARAAGGEGLPAVYPMGGLLTLCASAAIHGLPLGLALGLAQSGPLTRRMLAGAAVGLVAAGAVSALTRDQSCTLALGAIALCIAAAAARTYGARRTRVESPVAATLGVVLVAAAWWQSGGAMTHAEHAGSEGFSHESFSMWDLRSAGAGWSTVVDSASGGLALDGRLVSGGEPARLVSERLAGHLAALLAKDPKRVLVVGHWHSVLTQALGYKGAPTLEYAAPLPPFASFMKDFPGISAPSPAALRGSGPYDAVIVALADPTLPQFQAYFTPSGRAQLAELLAPGGVLVQLLDLDRLPPDVLLREIALVRETMPDAYLALPDLGRGGLLILVAPAPDQGVEAPGVASDDPGSPSTSSTPPPAAGIRPLDLSRLLDPARFPPDVQTSLREALVLTPAHLLAAFIAGPAEIEALGADVSAADPWTPGGAAFVHAPPREIARGLAQAFFLDHLQVVDLPVLPGALLQPGEFGRVFSFVALETRLGSEWAASGQVRTRTTATRFLGAPGVYREGSRRLELAMEGRDLTVTTRPMHDADLDILQNSMDGLKGKSPRRQGSGFVHDHPALWAFEELSIDEQIITATWHCPIAQRLFGVKYHLTVGVKPGLFEGPLEFALGNLRCAHGPAGQDVTFQPFGPPPQQGQPATP